MRNYVDKYIDSNIIRENAIKTPNGYIVEVESIDNHEKESFLSVLFEHDATTKELILDRMQKLIDSRLPLVECSDKYEAGLRPVLDSVNGDVQWV